MGRRSAFGIVLSALLGHGSLAFAKVTYDGTDGVYQNIFDSNSQERCLNCHDSSLSGAARNSASEEVDFDTYSRATQIPSYRSGSEYRNSLRAKVRVADQETMPAAGALTAAEQALITDWINDGELKSAAPDVNTWSAYSVSKYGATLRASVNENGDQSQFWFRYDDDTYVPNGTKTPDQSPSGTGGGRTNTVIYESISGLNCGTTYYFRAYGSNAPGSTTGDLENFTTDPCPEIDPISTQSATEEDPFYYDVNANMGGLDYSLDTAPTGLDINQSTGEITGTPDDPISSSETVMVRATDGTEEDAESFTLDVTLVDDPPVIISTPPTSATEDNLYTYNVTVEDPDDSSFDYALTQAPQGMSVDTTGTVEWVPPQGAGNVDVTLEVSDATSTDSQSWTISVDDVNDPPVIDSTAPTEATEDELYEYQVKVKDPDDDNNGTDLDWSLSGQPKGMSISSTGRITWTPGEGITSSGTVTVTVADGGENGATPDSEDFTISVTPVNDPPAIVPSPIPDQTVEEKSTFSLNLKDKDPDDANDGQELDWSLNGAPAGMSISSTGTVTWTPGEGTAGDYTATVTLVDGGEDDAAPDTEDFLLTVNLKDADGDGVADYNDNCVNTANADQADFDGDGLGDACDPDDDNDGIHDTAEENNGLDPKDPSDADGDLDGDGLTNLEEFQNCQDSGDTSCDAIGTDSVAPEVTVEDKTVDSTGYFTEVELNASAVDGVDGEVEATPDQDGPFRPGRHTITWSATDSAGNTGTAEQTLDVRPRVKLGGSEVAAEGDMVSVPVRLNGAAPSYPVELELRLGGQADTADHDAANPATVTLNSGTEANLQFRVLDDGVSEGNERLEIHLDSHSDQVVADHPGTYRVLIAEEQLAPDLRLFGVQSSVGREIYRDEGDALLVAVAEEANGDSLSFNVSSPRLPLTIYDDSNAGIRVWSFDPNTLKSGTYRATVMVSDAIEQVRQDIVFRVRDSRPALDPGSDTDGDGMDDASEGVIDSDLDGVPDYRDGIHAPELLVLDQKVNDDPATARWMKAEPGVSLSLGARVSVGDDHATPPSGSLPPDEHYTVVGELYDFTIRELTAAKRRVRVVVPLAQSIPPDAVWRKFSGGWYSFQRDGRDRLESAPRADGHCPDPLAGGWQSGLNTGDECVRLTLTDGGPNDADGRVNGVIRDPGGVAVPDEPPEDGTHVSDPAHSAGAWSLLWFLTAGLLWLRGRSARAGVRR